MPAHLAAVSASASRSQLPLVTTRQTPFWAKMLWFFNSTRSPLARTIPSRVAAPLSVWLPLATVEAARTRTFAVKVWVASKRVCQLTASVVVLGAATLMTRWLFMVTAPVGGVIVFSLTVVESSLLRVTAAAATVGFG